MPERAKLRCSIIFLVGEVVGDSTKAVDTLRAGIWLEITLCIPICGLGSLPAEVSRRACHCRNLQARLVADRPSRAFRRMHKSNSFADKADGALDTEAARVFIIVEPWGALRWENVADARTVVPW